MSNPVVKSTANSALSFMDTLQGEQNQAFAGNQAALSAIQSAWAPILAGGAIPAGYSAGLDNLLQTQIRDTGAQGTANAEDAAALKQQQLSGGAPGAGPSGASQAIDAQIEATGQQSTAKNLQAEKTADYQQGVANLEGATTAEQAIANGESDVGLAGASTGAGSLAASAGNAEWQENQTSSIGSILGDLGAGAQDASAIFG